jgi:hypothetical protein
MTRLPSLGITGQIRQDKTDFLKEKKKAKEIPSEMAPKIPYDKEIPNKMTPKIQDDEKADSEINSDESKLEKVEEETPEEKPETETWTHFFFPETQIRISAPKGWVARNETKFLKSGDEGSGVISIGKLYVTKEAVGQRRHEQDAGFKTGIIFYPNYQDIANMSYADTEAFANSVIPGFFAQFQQIKGRTESALRTSLGEFRLFEADVSIDRHDFHYVYGFCKNDSSHLLFVIQTPTKDWEKNQPFFFNLVSQITLKAQARPDDEIVSSVFDQSAE